MLYFITVLGAVLTSISLYLGTDNVMVSCAAALALLTVGAIVDLARSNP